MLQSQSRLPGPVVTLIRKRHVPASFLYWSLGIALGALALGITTIPRHSASTGAVPKLDIVRNEVSGLLPVNATAPEDSVESYFMILLDPLPHHRRVTPRDLESTLKSMLAREGFPNIGVSVSHDRTVYLAGTLFDESEKYEILALVRRTPGVSSIHFGDSEVRKLYGPAYFGAETVSSRDGEGVRVVKVYSGSPAEMAGIRAGDVITEFGDRPVTDPESLRFMVISHIGGQRIPVKLSRDGQPQTVKVRLGELPAIASRLSSRFPVPSRKG